MLKFLCRKKLSLFKAILNEILGVSLSSVNANSSLSIHCSKCVYCNNINIFIVIISYRLDIVYFGIAYTSYATVISIYNPFDL